MSDKLTRREMRLLDMDERIEIIKTVLSENKKMSKKEIIAEVSEMDKDMDTYKNKVYRNISGAIEKLKKEDVIIGIPDEEIYKNTKYILKNRLENPEKYLEEIKIEKCKENIEKASKGFDTDITEKALDKIKEESENT